MKKIGQSLMKESDTALSSARWISMDLISSSISASADLVVASYVLNEMSEKDRTHVLDELWKATKQVLLIVEPGTPVGYNVLNNIRTYLLGKGAHIIAPCPHEKECRISGEDWCHFSCRVQRSKTHKMLKDADVPYEDEKYSYIAFSKDEVSQSKARILRHPFIDKGQITLEVCTATENKTVIVKKKDGALFKAARKAKHGDSIDVK